MLSHGKLYGLTDLTIGTLVVPYRTLQLIARSHGTSHGVGSFLNVHEGPQGLNQRIASNDTPIRAGMVISNEPGYYADGKFGIRIENMDVIRMAETRENFGNKGYLELEHVTMVSGVFHLPLF